MSTDHKSAASNNPKTADKANVSSTAPAAKPAEAAKPAVKS